MAEKQKAKGFVSMTTKSGEIMWVHTDIVKDEQWESNKFKLKGKSCNTVSLTKDDDAMTIASLSDSEEEKFALAAQPAATQPLGTRSGRPYSRQYDQTVDETQRPMTSGTIAPVQVSVLSPALDKKEAKGGLIDKLLKKNPSKGLNAPFRFDILSQLANISAQITLHELLHLSKEIREALKDALAN